MSMADLAFQGGTLLRLPLEGLSSLVYQREYESVDFFFKYRHLWMQIFLEIYYINISMGYL